MTNALVLSTAGHLVSVASRGFVRLSESRLRPLGFGPGYLPVLTALQDNLADTQRDLARVVKMGQPPMAQMLSRMERDGLVVRTADPEDGRSQKIALTTKAKSSLPVAITVLMEGNEDALAGFTQTEMTQLITMLERLIANLDKLAHNDGKTPR